MLLSCKDQLVILSFLLYMSFLSYAEVPLLDDCNSTGVVELSYVLLEVGSKNPTWTHSLDLYFFEGFQRRPSRLFLDVHLQVNLTDRDVKIYQGDNCSAVLEQYNSDHRLFGLLRQFSLLRSKQLSPFDRSVIGIATNKPYSIRVRIWEVNYLRAGTFIGAIVLYVLSYSLVRNAVFFYSSGCAVGLIASLLIVGFAVYRFAPKKWIIGLPLLFGGWSVSFYGVYILWRNFTNIILCYQKFVAAYFATVVILSFAVCYRYGPPTDVRSHNLAQWALQLIALIVIYFSCQIDEISISVIVILIVWTCTKYWILRLISKILSVILFVWHIFSPKTRRLLTPEEYEQQGIEETRKAMEQLRSYCRSPKADAWKITSSISDPKKFASFIEGNCEHIGDEEIRLHEIEGFSYAQFSDDSGEDEYLWDARDKYRNTSELSNIRYASSSRNRSRLNCCSFRSRSTERRRNYESFNNEDDESGGEEDGESGPGDFHSIPKSQLELNSHLASSSKEGSLKRRRFQQQPGTEYHGLLMPIPSHSHRSDLDRLCTYYNLSEQQLAIYDFLKFQATNREDNYVGESVLSIKQSLPKQCFDEVEFDNDLERLVEVNLIEESFLDGYWRTT